MKGLLLHVLALIGLITGVNAGEIIQMTFRLPTYLQEDRDLFLIQKFLLAQVERKISRSGYMIDLSEEGELEICGDQDEIESFSLGFETHLNAPLTEEVFLYDKETYLRVLQDLGRFDEEMLLSEMSFEKALEGQKTLLPLSRMIQCAAHSLGNVPQVELVENPLNYQLYYNLQMSEDQQSVTTKLIKKMGDSGYWELLKIRKEMEKLGDAVAAVHPLRFIGYIYGNPGLKKRMATILDDIFKRRGFLNGHGKKEGFSQKMTKEANNHNLMKYLPGFAQSLGITQSSIEPYFHRHDWEGLLRHLAK